MWKPPCLRMKRPEAITDDLIFAGAWDKGVCVLECDDSIQATCSVASKHIACSAIDTKEAQEQRHKQRPPRSQSQRTERTQTAPSLPPRGPPPATSSHRPGGYAA